MCIVDKGDFNGNYIWTECRYSWHVSIVSCGLLIDIWFKGVCFILPQTLWESLVCNDYLDETYPETQLNPTDPYVKAKQRILVERWGKVRQHHTVVDPA